MNLPTGGEGWGYIGFNRATPNVELLVQVGEESVDRYMVPLDRAGLALDERLVPYERNAQYFAPLADLVPLYQQWTLPSQLFFEQETHADPHSVIGIYGQRQLHDVLHGHFELWKAFTPPDWIYIFRSVVEHPDIVRAYSAGTIPSPLFISVQKIEEPFLPNPLFLSHQPPVGDIRRRAVAEYNVTVTFLEPPHVESVEGAVLIRQRYQLSGHKVPFRYLFPHLDGFDMMYHSPSIKGVVDPDLIMKWPVTLDTLYVFSPQQQIEVWNPNLSIERAVELCCEDVINGRYKTIVVPFQTFREKSGS